MLLRRLLPVLAIATFAMGNLACGGEEEDELGLVSSGSDEETTREGDEQVSADALKLGEANARGFAEPSYSDAERLDVLSRYAHIDPTGLLPETLRQNVLQYYHFNLSRIDNPRYVTVIDMGQHSRNERFFLVNMEDGSVWTTVVAHGSGSDPNHTGTPVRFSNTNNSNQTSLGYYRVSESYQGKYGYSARLDGLSATNSNARRRAVVMHGANYVSRGSQKQGRSWGCPAIPMNERQTVIGKLREGSLLYIDSESLAAAR